MNRNQKIAIGCGAAGCLGLIVIVIVGCILFLVMHSPANNRNTNINRGTSLNANSSSSSNSNSDGAGDEDTSSSSSVSDDDKHKLFQAAGGTRDTELMQRVLRKLDFIKADGSSTDEYTVFLKDHITWALKNVEFIQSVSTPEKARAYVEEHIND